MSELLAARYRGAGILEIDNVGSRVLGKNEVRIAPQHVGLCGTDAHILHGSMDARVEPGTVLGHEMSGLVLAVGDSVSRVAAGELVVVRPVRSCDSCRECKSGYANVCPSLSFLGIDADGALQSEWLVPEHLVHRANGIDSRLAALTEPLAVAVHDVRRSRLGRNDRCLVVGGGPVGVLIALVARAHGGEVTLLETNESRRNIAQSLGIRAVEPMQENEYEGFDYAFEVTGTSAGVIECLNMVRARGTVVIVGIQTSPDLMSLFSVFWKELTILGARLYDADDFEKALEYLGDPNFDAEKLITHVINIEDVPHAPELMESGESMKILVKVGRSL